MGLGGRAIAEVRVSGPEGLEQLPGVLESLGGRLALLGQGTNILAADADHPLVLVGMAPCARARIVGERDGAVLLRADGGMRLPGLLGQAASLGLAGLEGLAGIPGSVGGAVAMNAGSYGTQIGDLVMSAQLLSPQLGVTEQPGQAFDFAYRHCALRGHEPWFLVSAVTLALRRGKAEAIRARMREVYGNKRATQPVTAKSAGCVFKNPAPDAPAGRLMEEAGLKGQALGGMRFSPLHANFLINEGGGTFAQAMELLERAKEKVRERSGYLLETEVRIWR